MKRNLKAFPSEDEIRYTLCIKLWLPYMPTREELIFEIERSRGRIGTKRRGAK